MDTSLVLLDEPLASLDVHLRAAMESEFVEFHDKTRSTMIYITHDQSEAMALADRIAVMDAGRLVQVARPEMLYREPATVMVADFIGQGVVVSATATAPAANGRCAVDLFGQEALLRCRPGQQSGSVKVSLRPESLTLAGDGIPGHVRRIVYRGGANDIEVTVDGPVQETLLLSSADAPEIGAPVHIGDPEALGIEDVNRPDLGDPAEIRDGEVPVFWACGVTPQAVAMSSKPPFMITHSPGHMFITDVRDEDLAVL